MTEMENKRNCSTMFTKVFEHIVITNVKCGFCHKDSQTKRICNGHVVDIQGRLTISEALEDYFAEEIVETYNCKYCKTINENEAKKKYVFESAPRILYLMLNRFKNRMEKLKDSIELNAQLELEVSSEKISVKYKLASIVNHIGNNLFEGHYTAIACCSSNTFYEFDDGHVHKISGPDGCNAYILIYELSTEVFII